MPDQKPCMEIITPDGLELVDIYQESLTVPRVAILLKRRIFRRSRYLVRLPIGIFEVKNLRVAQNIFREAEIWYAINPVAIGQGERINA